MKYLMFDDFGQWRSCLKSGAKNLVLGLVRLATCLLGGILSLVRALWRLLVKTTAKYPHIVLGAAMAVCVLIWVLTFVCMRVRVVGVECQRDSLSYELSKYTQADEEEPSSVKYKEVVVHGDTIQIPIWKE